jgi:hypothetical protein
MPEVALISGRDFSAVQKIATICPTSEFIRGIPAKLSGSQSVVVFRRRLEDSD